MRYAISNWIYGDEALEATFARLQRFGYDGIELRGEPREYDPNTILGLCRQYNLQVLSLAGMYPWPTEERDLANPDARLRARAVAYLKECVEFAAGIGAPLVIVVPAPVARTSPVGTFKTEEAWVAAAEQEWGYAVDSVRQAADEAEARGILLAIEPINRYETFLVNTCDQALRFVAQVNSPAVGVHLDTFHMNIEECDPAEAIRRAGPRLINFHVADSNREAVGRGHIDFRAILRALHEIGYSRSLALEPLPPVPDPYIAARIKRYQPLRDVYAEESIARLKAFEAEAARS